MKITNKTVGWGIQIIFMLSISIIVIIEQISHGCEYFDKNCGWSAVRLIWSVMVAFGLIVFIAMLLDDDIRFEYEIKLPKSNRKTLNKLYSKMGEAAMRGDEAEEKRIWDVIQKMENR